MKKYLFLLAVIPFFVCSSCDDDDDKQITFDRLPAESQLFIETHFKDATVRMVEVDNDGYDVYFSNGYDIEFYKSGEWKNVDGNYRELPASFLMLSPFDIISAYVNDVYPRQFITEVDKDRSRNGFEVTLNSSLELIFEKDGAFRHIDY